MLLKRLCLMPVSRPGKPVGCRAWILVAMFHLAMDFSSCETTVQGQRLGQGVGSPRPVARHRTPSARPPWEYKRADLGRFTKWWWLRALHSEPNPPRAKPSDWVGARSKRAVIGCPRCRSEHSASPPSGPPAPGQSVRPPRLGLLRRVRRRSEGPRVGNTVTQTPTCTVNDGEGRVTVMSCAIDWGPTRPDYSSESSILPGEHSPRPSTTTVALLTSTRTAPRSTTTTRATATAMQTTTGAPRTTRLMGLQPGSISTAKPRDTITPRSHREPGEAAGLAVHQIITITVSLIMVVAALITTLVLKNCCAQNGNRRRNNHQRKINHQEESCQNLTDFTATRVPSNMDIFTAYNETLQCSHECVRASMPVYADQGLHQTVYKTTFNGNRISPPERQLIPVPYASEKWYEISC
eukprot:gi/632960273/ref/XP_007896098.1/ PREDICTED: adherens junction-associated protein 1 [Callorhinchus milii]